MMDDTNAFERLVASRLRHHAGPAVPVDDAAVYHSVVAATRSPVWSLGPMFGTTKSVVVGALVALLGGSLIVAQDAETQHGAPGAAPDDPGTFSPTGSLAQPRGGHSATLLPDGRVLVVGGDDGLVLGSEIGTTTAEVWDPETGTFGPTGSTADRRVFHTATLLPDGRVLVVGSDDPDSRTSAEVWDPSTGLFSPAGSLAEARGGHTATLLSDGRVLISGSYPPVTPEIWDPATSTFSAADSLPGDPGATALADGRVLLFINELPWDESPQPVEIWDPVTDTHRPAGSLAITYEHTTLLPDGRVLAVGPKLGTAGDEIPTVLAEVWDPATGTFSPAGERLSGEYYFSTATALPDGRVLVVGGCHDYGCALGYSDYPDSADVWDPDTATFSPTGSLGEARTGHTATPLADGRVLVVGGWGQAAESVHASAEIWSPNEGQPPAD